jgi:hypothetical protein
MELCDYLATLKRRKWLLMAAVLVAALVAAGITAAAVYEPEEGNLFDLTEAERGAEEFLAAIRRLAEHERVAARAGVGV